MSAAELVEYFCDHACTIWHLHDILHQMISYPTKAREPEVSVSVDWRRPVLVADVRRLPCGGEAAENAWKCLEATSNCPVI